MIVLCCIRRPGHVQNQMVILCGVMGCTVCLKRVVLFVKEAFTAGCVVGMM